MNLDQRIAHLLPEVAAGFREELHIALRTLRDAGNIPGTIVSLSRMIEGERGLLGCVAQATGRKLKDSILDKQIEELAQKGIIPAELASDLHWLRVRANKARHNIEKLELKLDDAETALGRVLRVLEWFYCEYAHGPRLNTIYTQATTLSPTVPQMLAAFLQAQQKNSEQIQLQQAELSELKNQLRQPRQALRERVVGPVPSSVVRHFKDRVQALRTLRQRLKDENLRLLMVCGRGGMGKTALIAKLVHDMQREFASQTQLTGPADERIVYIALRQSEFRAPDKIVELICRTVAPETAAELSAKWQQSTSLEDKLEFLFRRIFSIRRYIIVFDNFEDVLDKDNGIPDEFAGLRLFVEKCLEYDHGARIVATSRRTLVLSSELEGRVGERRLELPLDEGLPPAEAITLLRELDHDGRLGIQDAHEQELHRVVQDCYCIPRTLETLVGVLRQRRTLRLPRFLAEQTAFARLIENPARELYENLSTRERLAVQVLALFNRPVPRAAVRYLLPGLPVTELLEVLVRNYVIGYDYDTFFLHPLDQLYAYQQIPADGGDYSRRAWHQRAAAFWRSLRRPAAEWLNANDLEPQLQEFYHLKCAGEPDAACRLLNEIDLEYLSLWGYAALVCELRLSLEGKLITPEGQETNCGNLGLAYLRLGQLPEASTRLTQAISLCDGASSRFYGLWLTNIGIAYSYDGAPQIAIEYYRQALVAIRDFSNYGSEAYCLGVMGSAYALLGEASTARDLLQQALAGSRSLGNQRNSAAWLIGLGAVHINLGAYSKAAEHCQEALALSRNLGYRRGESYALGVMGEALAAQGCWSEALSYYEQALTLAQDLADQHCQAQNLYYLGSAYHHLGLWAKAGNCYQEAAHLGSPLISQSCFVKLGLLAQAEKNEAMARDWLAQGSAISRKLLQTTPNLLGSLYVLGLACLAQGKATEAITIYQNALAISQSAGVIQAGLHDLRLLQQSNTVVEETVQLVRLLEQSLASRPV